MPVRIGLAYNLKPALFVSGANSSVSAKSSIARQARRALRPDLEQPDLYAEWDEPETIDAVARALSALGEVIRLEADATFPERLQATRRSRSRPTTHACSRSFPGRWRWRSRRAASTRS